MINNRLFKKVNSIFWGVLTWFPVVIILLGSFKTSGIDFSASYSFNAFLEELFSSVINLSSSGNDFFYNPLQDVFMNVFDSFGSSGALMNCVVEFGSWVCWVQVIRLFVYVFYWFIDLIASLFDLMTFNRKGDN